MHQGSTSNSTTFEGWTSDYCTRYPAVGKTLSESQSMRGDWHHALAKFSVETLRQATREIALLDPQPFPSEHLPKLVARCKSLTFAPRAHAAPVDPHQEIRYRCIACQDGGTIEVYHPMAYRQIKDGAFDPKKHLNTIVVACTCGEGDVQSRERRNRKGLKRFDAKRMKPVKECKTADQVAELTEFVLNDLQAPKWSGFEAYA
jgi:hypothetical protein